MSRNSHPCAKCHRQRFIENKKYGLCHVCNKARLDERKAKRGTSDTRKPKASYKQRGAATGLKSVRVINKVSRKQKQVLQNLRETYNFIDATREPKCTGCGSWTKPLSRSHTISQDRCKKIGKPELIWDKENIEFECFGDSSACHDCWQNDSWKDKKQKLLNFDRKLAYIKKHDEELYQRIINEL